MSFNAQVAGTSTHNKSQMSTNPILNTETTRQKGPFTGTIPSLPLVNAVESKIPTELLFLSLEYGTRTQINSQGVLNATALALSQVVIQNIQGMSAPGVVALQFEGGGSDYSLTPKTLHNLNNVQDNVLFFYYDNNAAKVLQAGFGGNFITIWEKRSAGDLKTVKVNLIDITTGNNLQFDNVYLWCIVSSHVWQ